MPKPIACIATGVHLGHKRFPDRHDRPKIKAWRCDLTALSQLYNLYFLACNDTIHIYQPSFPDQGLPKEPELILHPPVSLITGVGVDPEDPHSITRIHVDYLGREEILLATCDDGDVVGYRVDEIQRLLNRRTLAKDGELELADSDKVKVFLHRNVGASAWGLAVHREARIIAISANTHNVTVLAYALAPPISSSDSPDSSENISATINELAHDWPSLRRRDHTIILRAETNIPAIAFNNNGDDPTGRWLFSSSVDGKTLLWDLHHTGSPARVIQVGWCASTQSPRKAPSTIPGYCDCPDKSNIPHACWGAMFLDTRSASEMSPTEELTLESQEIPSYFRDMTGSNKRFKLKATANWPNYWPPNTEEMSSDEDDGSSMMVVQETLSEELEETSSNHETGDVEGLDSDADSDAMSVESGNENDVTLGDDTNEAENNGTMQVPESLQTPAIQSDSLFGSVGQPSINPQLPALNPLQLQPPNFADLVWTDTDVSSDEDGPFIAATTQAQIAYANAIRMPTRRPYCEVQSQRDQMRILKNPPIGPCLIITREEIYLYQRPFHCAETSFSDPVDRIISMRRPLHPGPWAPFLCSGDRMCYFCQIPELGVFVVASSIGRVGVFSLYWTRKKGEVLPQYGYKLEYLLPFENGNDEEVTSVKGARLVGVATGPVQGMFDRPEEVEELTIEERIMQPRRWRLLMYFTDHTIISFELSKRRVDNSPGLSELVV